MSLFNFNKFDPHDYYIAFASFNIILPVLILYVVGLHSQSQAFDYLMRHSELLPNKRLRQKSPIMAKVIHKDRELGQ